MISRQKLSKFSPLKSELSQKLGSIQTVKYITLLSKIEFVVRRVQRTQRKLIGREMFVLDNICFNTIFGNLNQQ